MAESVERDEPFRMLRSREQAATTFTRDDSVGVAVTLQQRAANVRDRQGRVEFVLRDEPGKLREMLRSHLAQGRERTLDNQSSWRGIGGKLNRDGSTERTSHQHDV